MDDYRPSLAIAEWGSITHIPLAGFLQRYLEDPKNLFYALLEAQKHLKTEIETLKKKNPTAPWEEIKSKSELQRLDAESMDGITVNTPSTEQEIHARDLQRTIVINSAREQEAKQEDSVPSPTMTRSTIAVPDPPMLDDGNYPRFADWVYLLERKMEINADHFPTSEHRLLYLVSRTTGEAQNILVSRMRSKSLAPLPDIKAAIEFLSVAYGAPDGGVLLSEEHNKKKLDRIERQSDETILEFSRRFLPVAVESGIPENHRAAYFGLKLDPNPDPKDMEKKYWGKEFKTVVHSYHDNELRRNPHRWDYGYY